MKTKYVFFVMVGLVSVSSVLIVAAAFFGNSIFEEQSEKIVAAKLEYKLIEEEQTSLIRASREVEKYAEFDSIARSIVPQDKDQAKTVREIVKIAEASGISLKNINFQTSTLGSGPATGTDQAKTAPPSQLKPVEGINGVYALEITISPDKDNPVPYNKFIDFLARIERNRRTSHVNKILLDPTQNGAALHFVITLNAYVKP